MVGHMADKKKVKEQAIEKANDFIEYYERQFKEPKRSTTALCNFIKKIIPSVKGRYNAIEVGCGGG